LCSSYKNYKKKKKKNTKKNQNPSPIAPIPSKLSHACMLSQ
jgi:hypothetical protein